MDFFNENVKILTRISLKFVPRGPINNIPSLSPSRHQAIIWTNDGLVRWCIYIYIYASLSLKELNKVNSLWPL